MKILSTILLLGRTSSWKNNLEDWPWRITPSEFFVVLKGRTAISLGCNPGIAVITDVSKVLKGRDATLEHFLFNLSVVD